MRYVAPHVEIVGRYHLHQNQSVAHVLSSTFVWRLQGERRRKAVRGCIVSSDLSVLNLIIVKKGEADLPGLTDEEKPRLRGPKRASKIRKLFNLTKDDDVRKYVNTYRKVRSKRVVGCRGRSKSRGRCRRRPRGGGSTAQGRWVGRQAVTAW